MAASTVHSTGDLPLKWAVGALWLAVIVSALVVVNVSHNCRSQISDLTELKRDYNHQQVLWGQYLLEQAANGSLSSVEKKAREELNMRVPTAEDIVVVRP